MKIIGNTVGTPLPKPDWKQTDPAKGDYIKNKPDFEGLENRVGAVSELVGDTAVAAQISSAIDDIPQADWNQNDETAKDYIKNRPFYADASAEVIILPEQDAAFEADGELYCSAMQFTEPLVPGETYKVIFDGQEYISTAEVSLTGYYNLCALPGCYNEYPFGIDGWEGEEIVEYFCHTNDTSASHHIAIIKLNSATIPQQYLDTDWRNIKNKPFNLRQEFYPLFRDSMTFIDDGSSYIADTMIGRDMIKSGALYQVIFDDKIYYLKGAFDSGQDGHSYIFKGPNDEDEMYIYISTWLNDTENVLDIMTNQPGTEHFIAITMLGFYELELGSLPYHYHYLDDIIDLGELGNYLSMTMDWNDPNSILNRPSIISGEGEYSILENQSHLTFAGAAGNYSHAEGMSTFASSEAQHVQGKYNIEDAENTYAHIVGNGGMRPNDDDSISEIRSNAHTLDWEGNAWFAGDIYVGSESGTNRDEGSKKVLTEDDLANISTVGESVEGKSFTYTDVYGQEVTKTASYGAEIFNNGDNIAIGGNAHAEGSGTKATGWNSHAEGYYAFAYGEASHAEGYESQAIGSRGSHAEGVETKSYGHGSHTEGVQTKASREGSHAEGGGTEAFGIYAHAEGSGTNASGTGAHAEGQGNSFNVNISGSANTKTFTLDAPNPLLQIGQGINTGSKQVVITGLTDTTITVSEAIFSIDVTNRTVTVEMSSATGAGSHIEGYGTTARGNYQHVQGKNNIADTTSAHIVGNGTDETLSNAHTVDWYGNAWFAGDVYVGSTSGVNKDEGSKKLVTSDEVQAVSNIVSGKADKTYVDTKFTDFVGDTSVATQISNAISGKADKTYVDSQDTTTLNSAKSYTDTKIANLLDNDTDAVDSIMELAEAMKDNADAIDALTTIAGNKVDKVDGKGLSTNDYTTAEKNKLAGIAAGAEVNVQSDWNATSGDALILNKPTIPTKTSQLTNDSGYLTTHQDISGKADKTYVDTKFTDLVGDTAVATQISTALDAYSPDWSDVQGKPENLDKAIIDVTELPTENIDEDLLYRLLTPVCIYNGMIDNMYIMHAVEALPETDILSIEMVSETDIIVHCYYVTSDESVSAYINDLGSSLLGGVPVGWYPIETLTQAVGNTYGGIIHSLDEATDTDAYYVMITYVLYSYKNEWTSLKVIGKSGYGPNAEVFNDDSNIASGTMSHAEGCRTTASGGISHAEGIETTASGNYSHAEGNGVIASGDSSHAEGGYTEATGNESHAEGSNTNATGGASHAEGFLTTASGESAHAEGGQSKAEGMRSHAEGSNTNASGDSSHAEGWDTIAASDYQHVQGKYNIEDAADEYAHIVGNGASDNKRSNAHTLDWDGNAWFAGEITVGADSIALATEDYVDAQIAAIPEVNISGKADKSYVDTEVAAVSALVGDTAVATQISTALTNYYTKSQIDALELITVADIDAICGTTIQMASNSEVTF